MTALAPSERTQTRRHKRHKSCIDWVSQMVGAVRRWYPAYPLGLLVDGGFAALKLGWRGRHLAVPVTLGDRLRLDAALYDPPPSPFQG